MSDNHTLMQQQMPASGDGWSDAAAEADTRAIRGRLLKFSDRRWSAGKEAAPVADGTTLVALATAAAWIKWEDGKPSRHIMREPGRHLPDRDDLGDTEQNQWDTGADGNPKDPWQNTRFVYLVDPLTAEAFTFSTSSWGGRNAVSDLGDQITRMRSVHPDALPVVELHAAEMPTKFGRKSRPVFKIVGWRTASGDSAAAVERQISHQDAKREIDSHEMDDEIPF